MIYDGMNGDPSIFYQLEDVIEFADKDLKLDMEKFNSVLGAERTSQFLDWDKQQGKDAGMTGTPSVYICGEKISWPDLEAIVDGYLLKRD
jgi:protein-disulfide isomerase